MSVFLNNLGAAWRGIFWCFAMKMGVDRTVSCTSFLRIYSGVSLKCAKGSKLTLGKMVKINCNTIVSCLNGGDLSIGDMVGIGPWNSIVCHKKISIGKNTILGPNVLIYDHDHVYDSPHGVERKTFTTGEISIGSDCWIGANVVILKGTHIGNRCVVAAGSVIKGVFEDDSLIVQKRDTEVRKINRKET